MFVDIESSKSALAVENILMPYKKGLFMAVVGKRRFY